MQHFCQTVVVSGLISVGKSGDEKRLRTKELTVVLHALAIQSVQHSMAGPVSCTCASVRLPTLSKVQRLAAKSSLVYLAFICAGERQPIVLQLYDSLRGLSAHVLDGILRMGISLVMQKVLSARLL